jgi:hypothetical protein
LIGNIRQSHTGFCQDPTVMDLKDIGPEFQSFLRDRRLVAESSIPCYAWWVSRFLRFTNRRGQEDVQTHVLAFVDKVGPIRRLSYGR